MQTYLSDNLLMELLALSAYTFYIFFSFCDGFGLKPIRKLIWAFFFLILSLRSFRYEGHFDLAVIILWSSLFAFILGKIQKGENLKGKL